MHLLPQRLQEPGEMRGRPFRLRRVSFPVCQRYYRAVHRREPLNGPSRYGDRAHEESRHEDAWPRAPFLVQACCFQPSVTHAAASRKGGEDEEGRTGREGSRRLLRLLRRLRGHGRHRYICQRPDGRKAFISPGMKAMQPDNRALPRGHRAGGRTAVLQKKLLSRDAQGSQVSEENSAWS